MATSISPVLKSSDANPRQVEDQGQVLVRDLRTKLGVTHDLEIKLDGGGECFLNVKKHVAATILTPWSFSEAGAPVIHSLDGTTNI